MKFSDYIAISADYGKLLVTNLMVINAGALLVFPSILEVLKRDEINLTAASFAAFLFVVGLVLAGLCGYIAYWNFMLIGMSVAQEDNKQDFKSKCTVEMLDFDSNKSIIEKIEKSIWRYEKAGHITMATGNILGLASGVAFYMGCFQVHQALRF